MKRAGKVVELQIQTKMAADKKQKEEDAKLRADLIALGETVGPINSDLVRGIYRKKLEKLRGSNTATSQRRQSSPARSGRSSIGRANITVPSVKPYEKEEETEGKISVQTYPAAKTPVASRSRIKSPPISSRTRRSAAVFTTSSSHLHDESASVYEAAAEENEQQRVSASSLRRKYGLRDDRGSNIDTVDNEPQTTKSTDVDQRRGLGRRSIRSVNSYTAAHDRSYRKSPSRRSEFSDDDDVLTRHRNERGTPVDHVLQSSRLSRRVTVTTPKASSFISSSRRYEEPDQDVDDDDELGEEELTPQFLRPRDFILDLLCNKCTVFTAIVALSAIIIWVVLAWRIPTLLPLTSDAPDASNVIKDPAYRDGMAYLRCLYKELSERKGAAMCGEKGSATVFNGKNMLDFVAKCGDVSETANKSDVVLNGLKAAILEYPNQFVINRSNVKVALLNDLLPINGNLIVSSANAAKPLLCRLSQSVSVVLIRIFIASSVVVCGVVLYLITKRRWMIDDEETRLMFMLVEKIIDALRQHRDLCQRDKSIPPYLPIPHVRDLLIPPSQRRSMERVWNKAAHFLSTTDSRIRVDTQVIRGEEFEVWKWIGIPTVPLKPANTSNHLAEEDIIDCGRTWQGPAFDEIEKVVRLPIVTPTPCLKIRFMHRGADESEINWDLHVRDALLEKCTNEGAKVLHIYVDKTSTEGCLYIKCSDLDSADKAFRSIYGNWYDGRLVIVKFVTLTRYHQRFPDALYAKRELYPSGAFPSSIVTHHKEA